MGEHKLRCHLQVITNEAADQTVISPLIISALGCPGSKASAISFFFFLIFEFFFLHSRFLLVIHFIHISVYMSIPISQFITPPPPPTTAFPPWCPYVCSLHLCLNFYPANRFKCHILKLSVKVYIAEGHANQTASFTAEYAYVHSRLPDNGLIIIRYHCLDPKYVHDIYLLIAK